VTDPPPGAGPFVFVREMGDSSLGRYRTHGSRNPVSRVSSFAPLHGGSEARSFDSAARRAAAAGFAQDDIGWWVRVQLE